MIRDVNPDQGLNFFPIPDPEPRGQKASDLRFRIRNNEICDERISRQYSEIRANMITSIHCLLYSQYCTFYVLFRLAFTVFAKHLPPDDSYSFPITQH
jgi:hypothetical protein